jgi:hypothetical protein
MKSGCIDSHFLDLGTSWRWLVSFTLLLLYPRWKNRRYPLHRRLGGPQDRIRRRGEEKFFPLPWLELRPLGRLARSQSLYRLRYPGSNKTYRCENSGSDSGNYEESCLLVCGAKWMFTDVSDDGRWPSTRLNDVSFQKTAFTIWMIGWSLRHNENSSQSRGLLVMSAPVTISRPLCSLPAAVPCSRKLHNNGELTICANKFTFHFPGLKRWTFDTNCVKV